MNFNGAFYQKITKFFRRVLKENFKKIQFSIIFYLKFNKKIIEKFVMYDNNWILATNFIQKFVERIEFSWKHFICENNWIPQENVIIIKIIEFLQQILFEFLKIIDFLRIF